MKIATFDTTLRDGTQAESVSFSVEDKLLIAEKLDELGIDYIEGGWPGSNPKDKEFFERARAVKFKHAKLTAFGATRFAKNTIEEDSNVAQLLAAGTPAVSIFGKSWDFHVHRALGITEEENLQLISDTVSYLKAHDREVIYDAEHFFDGYTANPAFALRTLEAAKSAGAAVLCLCDTNGGTLPPRLIEIVAQVRSRFDGVLGIHCHNDSDVAVANTILAVEAGATHVQGCINGYGERTGNADLSAAIPNLSLKLNIRTIPADRLERLTPVSHHIAELVNIAPNPQQPYVGAASFAHKAGLHTSAIARRRDAYEHVPPDSVGNGTRFVVSEMAGRSTLAFKAQELGLDLDSEALGRVLETLKTLEHRGYHFEVADGSLELLLRRASGWEPDFFDLESFRVIADHADEADGQGHPMTEATVKVKVHGERVVATAEGNGPVNALDSALRQAIGSSYPVLAGVHLVDYRVRVLDTGRGTGAVTRVLIDTTDGEVVWTTIGVSENIIEASWQALFDSIVYGLVHAGTEGRSEAEER
jgi:2-isopropylmalate synthase